MRKTIRLVTLALVIILISSFNMTVSAYRAEFEYKLILTDENGAEIRNPRSLSAGSIINLEIEMSMSESNEPDYTAYGIEFRLESRGLKFNRDGATFRAGTSVNFTTFTTGDVVGFAYYDLAREGEKVNNPMQVCRWSYTVTDPDTINITVPTALLYIRDDTEPYVPIGNAWLFLDLNGGKIEGIDITGEYKSGTVITLPEATFANYTFQGWTDGVKIYPPGSKYTVTGVVTLTAIWEDLVRSRQVIWDPQGGEFAGEDPSGMFADGEVVTMPKAQREGYEFDGWWLNDNKYEAGDQYTVDNSLLFLSKWNPVAVTTEPTESDTDVSTDTDDSGGGNWFIDPDGKINIPHIMLTVMAVILLAGLGWWLFLIFWKRRWVLYSLVNGDIALRFKDKKHTVSVSVLLYDSDEKYILGTSGVVKAGRELRFIKGDGETFEINTGKYKGLLIASNEKGYRKGIKCRIKVLDREISEREIEK